MKRIYFLLMMVFIVSGVWGQTTLPAIFDLSGGASYSFTTLSGTTLPANITVGAGTSTTGNFTNDLSGDASNGSTAGTWQAEGANGISILGGSSSRKGSFQFRGNSTGRIDIAVQWTCRTILNQANNNFIELQWRGGSSGAWNNVSGVVTSGTYPYQGNAATTTYSVTLPTGANNLSDLRIRWIYYEDATGGTRDRLAIDDITVSSSVAGTTATLANSINQTNSISLGTSNAVLAGFSITPTASVDFTAITVTSTGTATASDISNVRIFRDNDGNGAINGADAAVGGASSLSYSTSMVFSGISSETGLTVKTNYLVVADIAGTATPGSTVRVSSNTFTTTAVTNNGSFAGSLRVIGASGITDHFRSDVTTGNWNVATSWQSSPDGVSNWITATAAPGNMAAGVTIRNGHSITINANIPIRNVTVDAGGTLIVDSDFTLENLIGINDLIVNGTVINNSGTANWFGDILFNAGSLYQHERNGSVIPTATWNSTSTCEVNGMTSTAVSGLGQTFGNFTWDNTGQATFQNINSTGFGVQGQLWVRSTGSSNLAINGDGTARTTNIGSLKVDGGTLNLSFKNTGTAGLATVNVIGDVTINGGTLDFGAGSADPNSGFYRSILNIGGNLSVTSGATFRSSTNSGFWGKVNFNKAGTQTVNIHSGAIVSKLDYTVTAGSTTELLNSINVNYISDDEFDEVIVDGILDAGATAQVTGGGDFILNGRLKTSNPSGIGSSTGTLLVAGTIDIKPTSTVEYYAAGPQQFTSRSDYGNVIINGGDLKTLNGNATLAGNLTLTSGKAVLGANNLIVNGSVIGGSSSNYVVTDGAGVLRINSVGINAKSFPVGPNTSLYHPAIIANSGTTDNFSVRVSSTDIPCAVAAKSVTARWDISEAIAGGSNCAITLDYTGAGTGASYNSSFAKIVHCNGTSGDYSNGAVSGTSASGSGFTSFSPFGITSDPVALPVKFGNVKAYQQGSGVKVDWSNFTETDVVNYKVERSVYGQPFVVLGTVNAALNNGSRADYSHFDAAPVNGVNLYRIQSLETDGKKLHSVIVRVDTRTGNTTVSIYPNPASATEVSFQATDLQKGNYTIQVYNAAGQQVHSKKMAHAGGFVTQSLELPASLKAGVYQLQIISADVRLSKSFMIR